MNPELLRCYWKTVAGTNKKWQGLWYWLLLKKSFPYYRKCHSIAWKRIFLFLVPVVAKRERLNLSRKSSVTVNEKRGLRHQEVDSAQNYVFEKLINLWLKVFSNGFKPKLKNHKNSHNILLGSKQFWQGFRAIFIPVTLAISIPNLYFWDVSLTTSSEHRVSTKNLFVFLFLFRVVWCFVSV